jgi:prolipoprotein diacylglyceryltransferase
MEPTRDGVLDFLADRAMGILVLLFVVSYALIRPAYERFYEPMGLRPEDLGLNQIEMISSGAAILAGLILIPVVQIMLGVPYT